MVATKAVQALPVDVQLEVVQKIRSFNSFSQDNDPWVSMTSFQFSIGERRSSPRLTTTILIGDIIRKIPPIPQKHAAS